MSHEQEMQALTAAVNFWRDMANVRASEIDRLTAKVLELQRELGKLENPKQESPKQESPKQ